MKGQAIFTKVEKVRVDKWLWSVRIFKSRTISTDACKSGRVRINGEAVKASYLISVEEEVMVKKDGFNFQFRVLKLIEKRVGAPIAVTCYENTTTEEELNKYKSWFLNAKATSERREKGTGRPTKKERREIDKLKE